MPKIYLARHGQDEDNAAGILNGRRDASLTNIGIEQAKVLAEKIKEGDLGITKIYSSPLQRAYKTAETIADALSLDKPEINELLIERDFGVMTGMLINEIDRLCSPDTIKSNPITYFLSPEGAETFPLLIGRAEKLLGQLKQKDFDGDVLLVAHGDIGKMIYAAFYNLDWKETLTQFHFGNSEVLLLLENAKQEERYIHRVAQHNH